MKHKPIIFQYSNEKSTEKEAGHFSTDRHPLSSNRLDDAITHLSEISGLYADWRGFSSCP